jgi:hypothetical protein
MPQKNGGTITQTTLISQQKNQNKKYNKNKMKGLKTQQQ